MRTLVEYLNEGKINIDINDLKKRAENIGHLDPEDEKDFEVLNGIAMDLLDVIWHDTRYHFNDWKELYNMYHVSMNTYLNKRYEACKKHFVDAIEACLDIIK